MLDTAREAILNADHVLVVTGAGISAESGIPTFRGPGGLWEGHRAEDLANVPAFERDPAMIWRWYRWRRAICNDAAPNPGHAAIAWLEARLLQKFGWTQDLGLKQAPVLLATQNVDGLHPRSGNRALVEMHGNIDSARCTDCGAVRTLTEDPKNPKEPVPSCADCGAALRPHILWFGENYWPGVIELCTHHARQADVCLVVGTSGMVWPPIAVAMAAKESGAYLIDVNPNPSQLTSHVDAWLQGPSGELLPALLQGS
jgi:NAD-dependent deacetylase